MLNTRSRTVFTLKQSTAQGSGELPFAQHVVKKKVFGKPSKTREELLATAGQLLLQSALAENAFTGGETLESPGRLSATSHLAGTLARSGFRKDALPEVRDTKRSPRPPTLIMTTGIGGMTGAHATMSGAFATMLPEAPLPPSSPNELCYCSGFVPITFVPPDSPTASSASYPPMDALS